VDQSGGGVKIMCVHHGHQSINDFAHADLPAVRTPVRRPIVHRPVARTGTDPQRQTPGRAVDTGVGRASASTHSVPRLALPLPIEGAICADRRAACTSRAPSAARFRTWVPPLAVCCGGGVAITEPHSWSSTHGSLAMTAVPTMDGGMVLREIRSRSMQSSRRRYFSPATGEREAARSVGERWPAVWSPDGAFLRWCLLRDCPDVAQDQ